MRTEIRNGFGSSLETAIDEAYKLGLKAGKREQESSLRCWQLLAIGLGIAWILSSVSFWIVKLGG